MRPPEDTVSGRLAPGPSPVPASAPAPRQVFVRIVLIALAIRAALQAVGMLSLAAHGQPVWSNALDMWVHWDAHHYLRIAEIGYVTVGEDALYVGFFPLYPVWVRIASFVFRDLVVSGLVVSLAASVAASWLLYRLVRLDRGHQEAWRAVVLLFAFPTAIFFAAPYSEALFLAAVLAAVYLARRNRWGWAAAAGALATGTRPTGVALLPTLAHQALTTAGSWTQRLGRTVLAALAASGLLGFALVSWRIYGTPLQYLNVQRDHWHQGFVPPWVPVLDSVAAIRAGGLAIDFVTIHVGRLLGVAFAVALLTAGWRHLRRTDGLFGWTTFLLVLSTAWLTSLPRFLLVIYPLFIVQAWLARNRLLYWTLIVNGVVWQVFFMARYAAGSWTF